LSPLFPSPTPQKIKEKLKLAKQRGGPDDDDAAVKIIAAQINQPQEQLAPRQVLPQMPVQIQPVVPQMNPPAVTDNNPAAGGGTGRMQMQPLIQQVLDVNLQPSDRRDHVKNVMDQLDLAKMLDLQKLADEAAEAQKMAHEPKAVHQQQQEQPAPTQIPDYLLNKMKDEPPYGAPPDSVRGGGRGL